MTSTGIAWVAAANEDQLRAWDTAEGAVWADQADLFEHSLHRYDDWLLRAAGIRDGDHVLDVGCGTGSTTRAAAWLAGSGTALGVDLSSSDADGRRPPRPGHGCRERDVPAGRCPGAHIRADGVRRAAQPHRVHVLRGSGRGVRQPGAGGAAWRAGRPPGVAGAEPEPVVHRAHHRPRGRPSRPDAASGGAEPVRLRRPDAGGRHPHRGRLRRPGMRAREGDHVLGSGRPTAEAFVLGVLGWMLADADADTRTRAITNLRRTLVRHFTPGGVTFPSAAWLVTSRKPA